MIQQFNLAHSQTVLLTNGITNVRWEYLELFNSMQIINIKNSYLKL